MDRGYDYKKFSVLYVDDEEQALKYFRKAYSKEFEVFTVPSAELATQLLDGPDGGSVGVLITDQRMPGQTGVDLLEKVRAKRPDIIRIITTAYQDLDNAIEAVNTGAVFRYVTKPWEMRELRMILIRAMEFFLVQRERDMLLREKLGVLQRMIILDRVRSFTVLAASLACRVRNSMTALKAFFDLVPVGVSEKMSDSSVDWGDLWTLAQTESQRLVEAVDEVIHTTVDSDYSFSGSVSFNQLIRRKLEGAGPSVQDRGVSIELDLEPNLPPARGDEKMLHRLVEVLLTRLISLAEDHGNVKVRTSKEASIRGDVPGVRVLLTGGPNPWTAQQIESLFSAVTPADSGSRDMGMDVLAAFFIAHHHGGDLLIHPSPPLGPGFEFLLPLDPEHTDQPKLDVDWMDRIFTNLEAWGQLSGAV